MKNYRVTLFDEGKKFGPFDVRAETESDALMQAFRTTVKAGNDLTINTKCVVTPLKAKLKVVK